MASQKQKNKLIDKLNRDLERINSKSITREYSRVLNSIQKSALTQLENRGSLTPKILRNIINENPINLKVWDRSINNSYLSAGTKLLIQNDKMATTTKRKLAPIQNFMKENNVLNTSNYVKKINEVSHFLLGNKKVITMDQPTSKHLAIVGLVEYAGVRNAKTITRISKDFKSDIVKINRKLTTNLSKNIMKDLKRFKTKTALVVDPETGEVTKKRVPLTQEEVNAKMRSKYLNAANRVETIIRTEVHSQNEAVNSLDASSKGFKFKQWVNEGDSKVRSSHNDSRLLKQKPSVHDTFVIKNSKTGKSSRAMYPGDPALPPEERINCRCTVIYSN